MIYLDNAATTFPKPPGVCEAAAGVMRTLGGNPGRGGHRLSVEGARVVAACREEIAALLDARCPERVIFTLNCTDAINMAIRGLLCLGDHVICTHAEHNAVMRVLKGYETQGMIDLTVLQPDRLGLIKPETLRAAIGARTALCVIGHASNVTGVVQPASALHEVCRSFGVPMLLDAAQTAGVLPVRASDADMIAMPGHKGLYGPMGTGVLYVGDGLELMPYREGGTGSHSESTRQPLEYPDRLESGTVNLPGIAGLLIGARFARAHMGALHAYEMALDSRLRNALRGMPGVSLLGDDRAPRVAVTAFTLHDTESGALCDQLSRKGFALRGGLHCAPSIHEHLGTMTSGAARASVGAMNTESEVDAFCDTMNGIIRVYSACE